MNIKYLQLRKTDLNLLRCYHIFISTHLTKYRNLVLFYKKNSNDLTPNMDKTIDSL